MYQEYFLHVDVDDGFPRKVLYGPILSPHKTYPELFFGEPARTCSAWAKQYWSSTPNVVVSDSTAYMRARNEPDWHDVQGMRGTHESGSHALEAVWESWRPRARSGLSALAEEHLSSQSGGRGNTSPGFRYPQSSAQGRDIAGRRRTTGGQDPSVPLPSAPQPASVRVGETGSPYYPQTRDFGSAYSHNVGDTTTRVRSS